MPNRCHPNAFPRAQAASTQARRERTTMATTATETTSLIAFTLPSTPYSVQMARFYVRAALSYHDLGDYARTPRRSPPNSSPTPITHAGAPTFGLELTRLEDPGRWRSSSPTPHRSPGQARPGRRRRARARPAHRRGPVGPLGMAPARPRQGRVRDPHQGGMSRWKRSPTCRCSTTSTPTTPPVRQARPHPPRQDRVRPVQARRHPARLRPGARVPVSVRVAGPPWRCSPPTATSPTLRHLRTASPWQSRT